MSYSEKNDDHEIRIADRYRDDMASRRVSNHVPAPLRKKKNEDNYKRFITPIGNPMAALQKHMRSKSLSDLNAEKKEEEEHRAQINSRYEEMEKLKTMLKEDEDSWKSKLQGWKNRRRSVTEEARKRKEERDSLEREAEIKALRRKTKTYKEIVEDKKRRDRELADLNDHDEYEFVSPRSSEADMPVKIVTKDSSQNESETSSEDEPFPPPPQTTYQAKPSSYTSQKSRQIENAQNEGKVEYKYTTKVTAQIGEPSPSKSPQSQPPRMENRAAATHAVVEKFQGNRSNYDKQVSNPESQAPTQSYNSNVPKVLLRKKGQNTMKERPKSAHELMHGSSTLPRSYQYNPSPKPFVPGESEFMRYRKTAFASRRSMWESMGSNSTPQDPEPIHRKQSSEDLLLSQPTQQPKQTSTVTRPLQPNRVSQERISTPQHSVQEQETQQPLKSRAAVSQKPLQAMTQQKHVIYPKENTAKLSSSGLSMVSPRLSKQTQPPPAKTSSSQISLFDDMKICINQRPRSEKGFGFTVRGGDDGKPVIVDTVSAGGAADICQLCVSDEILAINDVPLAECKTQDDIVQLIVSSVITGHLSLNIRRYGKPKKTSSLGLSGTKVVMTPGGFVQVRSDKSGSAVSSPTTYRKSMNTSISKDDNNNSGFHNGVDNLPPPPSREELDRTMRSPEQSPRFFSRNDFKQNTYDSPRNGKYGAFAEVYSNPSVDDDNEADDLEKAVLDAQEALDFQPTHIKQDQKEKNHLRQKLQEEQKRLDQEEARRELERKKLQEEAKLEDQRVEQQLKRIQARKQKQMEERRALQQQQRSQNPFPHPPSKGMGGMHWLVEEAERRRIAESSGKLRMNALSQSKRTEAGSGSILPPHVIQHLTQRSTKAMGQSS